VTFDAADVRVRSRWGLLELLVRLGEGEPPSGLETLLIGPSL
jgi:hypothetical protein